MMVVVGVVDVADGVEVAVVEAPGADDVRPVKQKAHRFRSLF
jgi:hypothetical protein